MNILTSVLLFFLLKLLLLFIRNNFFEKCNFDFIFHLDVNNGYIIITSLCVIICIYSWYIKFLFLYKIFIYIYKILYIYIIYGGEHYSKQSNHKHALPRNNCFKCCTLQHLWTKSHKAHTSLLFYFLYVIIKSKLLNNLNYLFP